MKYFSLLFLGFFSLPSVGKEIKEVNTVTAFFKGAEAASIIAAFFPPQVHGDEVSYDFRDQENGLWLSLDSDRYESRIAYSAHLEVSKLHYKVQAASDGTFSFNLNGRESERFYRLIRGVDVVDHGGELLEKSLKKEFFSIECFEAVKSRSFSCKISF